MAAQSNEESCAYEMRILDPNLQAYLQRYPFATGPEPSKNLAGREAIRQTLRARHSGSHPEVSRLTPKETLLPDHELHRLQSFLLALNISQTRQRVLIDDFAWEVNLVSKAARNVLVVGCGDGIELVFLRAVLPQARITAIDYHDSLSPEIKGLVDPIFIEGDMEEQLGSLTGGYDLVFSNHTLEHLYKPDEVLQTLYRLLTPGGTLVSTLPMDANPGSPFLRRIARIAAAQQFNPMDTVFLDAGHPWKTNPADLNRSLAMAGFSEVEIYQRARHLSRPVAGGRLRLKIGKIAGLTLNGLFFGTVRASIKVAAPEKALTGISRILLAIERRVWFGSNNLKNRYAEEALIRASKSA